MLKIIGYDEKYKDEMITMILDAKRHLGREKPRINDDLLDIKAYYHDKGDMFFLGVNENDNVVATIGYNSVDGTDAVLLHRFYVRYDLKRQGIGTQMLMYVENYLKEHGKKTVMANLGIDYIESHHFYPKHGYEFYDTLKVIKHL